MYVDLWGWFHDAEAKAREANDTQRMRLPQIYHRGGDYHDAEHFNEARAEYERGLVLAQQLNEPWWEFLFEFWICEAVTQRGNYTEALDLCMKLVTKMQRPELKAHPFQAVVYYSLARIYYMIDTIGYEDEIYQALDMIENGMPLDRETHQRVYYLRAGIANEKEDWDSAYERILDYLQRVEGNGFRQRSGYTLKADIHFARGELVDALQTEQLREEAARRSSMWVNAAEAVIWQGILTKYLGDAAKAEALYQRGLLEFESLSVEHDSTFYMMMAEYQTVCGNLDEAFSMREKQLQCLQESGSVDQLFFCRLNRCYLLNQMQKPLGEEVVELEKLAQQHRKPAFFLKKVEEVRQGRCYPYDWQIALWQSH